jgi:hypothetical protein
LRIWVASSGKNLTTIYATHGHGDHFFGAINLLKRFPRARVIVTSGVVNVMAQQASRHSLTSFWNARFSGQISDHLVIAEELTGNVIDLEGRDLVAVPLGTYRHRKHDLPACPLNWLGGSGLTPPTTASTCISTSPLRKRAASGLPPWIQSKR